MPLGNSDPSGASELPDDPSSLERILGTGLSARNLEGSLSPG